jgi:hypothetical protein
MVRCRKQKLNGEAIEKKEGSLTSLQNDEDEHPELPLST